MNINHLLTFGLICSMCACAHADDDAPLQLRSSNTLSSTEPVPVDVNAAKTVISSPEAVIPMPEVSKTPVLAFEKSGYFDVGILQHQLSQHYPNWNGQFVRGFIRTAPNSAWQLELVNVSKFGDRGVLFVFGNVYDFGDTWYTTNSIASSKGGFFLSRYKVDSTLNRKWLANKNLVTGVSLGVVNAKDEHRDLSVMFSGSYHFTRPYVLEGGIRFNNSDPGSVLSRSTYVALTYGRDRDGIHSLRYGFGTEAYQTLGSNVQIANFKSDGFTYTWRQWFNSRSGIQLRLDAYKNPSYNRKGAEISLFQEF